MKTVSQTRKCVGYLALTTGGKNMKGKLQIALGIVVMGACMARAEAGDDWIKDMVIVSGQFIHGGEPARRMFENAKSQCEGDTNRFARLLCELAQTNDVRIADRMIRCLGRHGTTSAVAVSVFNGDERAAWRVGGEVDLAVGGCDQQFSGGRGPLFVNDERSGANGARKSLSVHA